jgi:hypothetical protein
VSDVPSGPLTNDDGRFAFGVRQEAALLNMERAPKQVALERAL